MWREIKAHNYGEKQLGSVYILTKLFSSLCVTSGIVLQTDQLKIKNKWLDCKAKISEMIN